MKFQTKRWIVRGRRLTNIRLKIRKAAFVDEKITLYEILVVFFQKMKNDDILDRAAGVAFSFTVALFPAIIFLFTLVPYIHQVIPEVDNESIMEFLSQWIPRNMFVVIDTTIDDIVSKSRGGLLTLGAVFALFLASNGTMALMSAFNSIYQTKENRTWIRMRMIATGLTIMLAVTMLLAIILLIVGQIALTLINDLVIDIDSLPFDINQVLILRFIVLFLVFAFAIAFLYYFAPAVHYKWQFFSIGAIFATVASLAVSYLFSFYVANFATYNKLYGSIGVMLALMVWLYIISVILLVGYSINASIHTVQYLHKIDALKVEKHQPKLAS
jgi:membrane protein